MHWLEKIRRNSSPSAHSRTSEDPLLQDTDELHQIYAQNRRLRRSLIIWKVISVISILLAIFQFFFLEFLTTYSYSTGWETEFADVRPHIRVAERRFGSVLTRDDNYTWFVGYNEGEPRYAGPPSDEIDKSWRDVLGAQYIPLTDAEVDHLNKDLDHKPVQEVPSIYIPYGDTQLNLTRGHYTTIGVVHQLHCLNMLRKHIDFEYYGNVGAGGNTKERAHLDHCVDTVRQALMCWGDTTPVPFVPWPDPDGGGQIVLADTERMRTCRNSKEIIEYTKWRGRVPTLENELVN